MNRLSKSKKVLVLSGKRKTAIARVTVRLGKGRIRINNVPLEIFEPKLARDKILEPLFLTDEKVWRQVDINVKVTGGGFMGQASASRTAIAKGLVQFLADESLQEMYTKYDRSLLVSDPRRKLPKKPLGRGARKKRQKSYR